MRTPPIFVFVMLALTLMMFGMVFGRTTAQFVATPNPFTLSNTIIDVGQSTVTNTVISGGSGGPYSGQWSFLNSNQVNNQVVGTITVGTNPSSVSFNPSGTLAYVTNQNSGTVNVIDVASNTVIGWTVEVAEVFALNIPMTGSDVIANETVHAEALILNGVIGSHVPFLRRYGAIDDDCRLQL